MKRLIISIGFMAAFVSVSIQTAQAVSVGDILITEVLPNPLGTDAGFEWVELQNQTMNFLDASGLKVVRASGVSVLTLPNGTILQPAEAHAYITTGALLNTGDTVNLLQATTLLDSITYDATGLEGQSWVRLALGEGTWSAAPTPGISVLQQTLHPSPSPEPSVEPSPSPALNQTPVPSPTLSPTPVLATALPTPNLDAVLPTPAVSPSAAVAPTSSPSPMLYRTPEPGGIIISELMPNPEGTDSDNEWVELKNVTDTTLLLTGLRIVRASGATVLSISDASMVEPGEYVAYQISGSLLNGGDTLQLLFNGALLDEVSYSNAPDGESWIRVSDAEGEWSDHPTQNAPNLPHTAVAEETDQAVALATTVPNATTKSASKAKTAASKTKSTKATKKASLPKTGPGLIGYVLPLALVTLYLAWKRRRS